MQEISEICIPEPLEMEASRKHSFRWTSEPILRLKNEFSCVREISQSGEKREFGELQVSAEERSDALLRAVNLITTEYDAQFSLTEGTVGTMFRRGEYFDFPVTICVEVRVSVQLTRSSVKQSRARFLKARRPSDVLGARCIATCSSDEAPHVEECLLSCVDRRDDLIIKCLKYMAQFLNPKRLPSVEDVLAGRRGLKSVQSKVQAMCYNNLALHGKTAYVSPKLDGERVLVVITDQIEVITSSGVDHRGAFSLRSTPVILDGELMEDGVVFVFDILQNGKRCTAKLSYDKRLSNMRKFLSLLPPETRLKEKPVLTLKEARRSADPYCGLKRRSDGLIFTPKGNAACVAIKWKPAHQNTIDFYVQKHNGDDYILKVSRVTNSGVRGVVMHPPDVEDRSMMVTDSRLRDNCVAEFCWEAGRWKFLKIREDKQPEVDGGQYYGNSEFVSIMTWYSIRHPISEKMAFDGVSLSVDTLVVTSYADRHFGTVGVVPQNCLLDNFQKLVKLARPKTLVLYLDGISDPRLSLVVGYLKTWYTGEVMKCKCMNKSSFFIRGTEKVPGYPTGPKKLDLLYCCSGFGAPKGVKASCVRYLA